MKVFIVEDEIPAAEQLSRLVLKLYPDTEIIGRADSIESAVRFFKKNVSPDLVFMDIQLADGLSFDIFSQVEMNTPVIFTTAFDQYALKAFKVNSVDYLLKPIEEEELRAAIQKHRQLKGKQSLSADLVQLLSAFKKPVYRERLMSRRGAQFLSLKTENLAYCYADDKICFLVDRSGSKYLSEDTLSQLEEDLNPSTFFRINRGMLVHIDSIKKVHAWLGSRLKLELSPGTELDTIVSRNKVNDFKAWFDGRLA